MNQFKDKSYLFIFKNKKTNELYLKCESDSLIIQEEKLCLYDITTIGNTPIYCKDCLEIMRAFKSNFNVIGGDLTLLSFFYNENNTLDENLESLNLNIKNFTQIKKAFKVLTKNVQREGSYQSYKQVYLKSLNALYSIEKEGLYVKKEEVLELQLQTKNNMKNLHEEFLDLMCNDDFYGSVFDRSIENREYIQALFFCNNTIKDFCNIPRPTEGEKVVLQYLRLKSKLSKTLGNDENTGLLPYMKDGIIHSEFALTNTATGRTSSRNPNIQNVDKDKAFRKTFRRDGYKILNVDMKGAEIFLLACFANDTQLQQDLINEVDIHLKTAREIAHTKDRKIGKSINFGLNYGMGSKALFAILKKDNPRITLEDCNNYIQTFFEKKIAINNYFNNIKEQATTYGKVTTAIHEVRHTRSITQAMNYPLQRGCVVICLLCMQYFYKKHLRLFNFIHDEFFFYIKEGEEEEYLQEVKKAFTYAKDKYNELSKTNILNLEIKYTYNIKDTF